MRERQRESERETDKQIQRERERERERHRDRDRDRQTDRQREEAEIRKAELLAIGEAGAVIYILTFSRFRKMKTSDSSRVSADVDFNICLPHYVT